MSGRQESVPEVTSITVDRGAMELRLAFDDGTTGSVGLVALRLACPCAGCRAARQQGGAPWPPAGRPDPPALSVTDAEVVGAWGLGITWNDGHATGIYPFEALHRWITTGDPGFAPDSGLGG